MYGWKCALGSLWILILVAGHAVAAVAQGIVCEAFDADGDGIVEATDVGPLISEFATVSKCMSTDFSAALACEPFDLNGDGHVTLIDFSAVETLRHQCFQVFGTVASAPPECALFDVAGDGYLDLRDYSEISGLVDRLRSCAGVDLSVLECARVDFNGDAAVSIVDRILWNERLGEFQSCVGTRIGSADGLWIGRDRLMSLPTHGPAWERVFAEAVAPYEAPDLSDQNDPANTRTLAKALVGVRMSRVVLIEEVRRAIQAVAYGTSEQGATALAVARELAAYVFAADIIELPVRDPALDQAFRDKLRALRDTDLRGRTLVSTHENRPNNWGTHAGATRVAIALYLEDDADLAAAAEVHRAWLGDQTSHTGFRFGALTWQADASHPVAINPRGASLGGIDLDGALPEEMRRGGPLADPPAHTGYAWEALQGATVATELLARHGYPDAWSWGDDALLRAVDYLYRLDAKHGGWWAYGDDRWIPWLVNHGTGSGYAAKAGVTAGKNVGFTDWTHAD